MSGFEDHFSAGARGYAAFRPTYPAGLFGWIASECVAHDLAWDCATGNGQAARGLAPHFSRVIATDASEAQVTNAEPTPNIEYRVAAAESSGLAEQSVDVVTVAQALHWFDRPRFYAEVNRVIRPGGPIVVWMYDLLNITPEIDAVIHRLYESLAGFWPASRYLVEQAYRPIEFPFAEIPVPSFAMSADWRLSDLLGYLRTWSGVQRYTAARGDDPVTAITAEIASHWGDPGQLRPISWPLVVKAGRVAG